MACLSVDVSNAFNTIDRAAILRALYSCPELSACWRTVAFGYGKPSQLLMRCDDAVPDSEAFIESQTGVRQGDPLAAYLFSLGMHPVYEELSKLTSHGCFAFIDDGHYVGTIEQCWAVWERVAPLLHPLGLSVNVDKCEFTCFFPSYVRHPGDISALDRFRSTNLKVNDRTLKLLGCVIGVDDGIVARELADDNLLRNTRTNTFRRIAKMRKQTGMLIYLFIYLFMFRQTLNQQPTDAKLLSSLLCIIVSRKAKKWKQSTVSTTLPQNVIEVILQSSEGQLHTRN
jgi:hypothetical protein